MWNFTSSTFSSDFLQHNLCWIAACDQAEKNRLVKNVLLEKEGQKRTAVQKEYGRTRKCAVGVLHFLLRGGLALD
jgi:hypothetical protein